MKSLPYVYAAMGIYIWLIFTGSLYIWIWWICFIVGIISMIVIHYFYSSPSSTAVRLLTAASSGSLHTVRSITDDRLLNERDGGGCNALTLASQYGHVDVVRHLMLLYPASDGLIRSRNVHTGTSPMHVACIHGHLNVVQCFLNEFHGGGLSIDDGDMSKRTPLHWAVLRGHKDIATILTEHGANIEARTASNMTPIELTRLPSMMTAIKAGELVWRHKKEQIEQQLSKQAIATTKKDI